MNTAVAFLVFKRPEHTRRVFEAIRAARPPRLLVVADGPRNPDERRDCEAALAIFDEVDWPCEVEKNVATDNLGCKRRIASGLDWVFDRTERAIVLEDDCLPSPSFFRFCDELLERFRDEERVMQIGGFNPMRQPRPGPDYRASRFVPIWGWASWARAWKHYDREMSEWPRLRRQRVFRSFRRYERVLVRHFDAVHRGEVNTWDAQWWMSCLAQDAVGLLPERNLVRNIGFDVAATHTADDPLGLGALRARELDFPLRHPRELGVDPAWDRAYAEASIGRVPPLGLGLLQRAVRSLSRGT